MNRKFKDRHDHKNYTRDPWIYVGFSETEDFPNDENIQHMKIKKEVQNSTPTKDKDNEEKTMLGRKRNKNKNDMFAISVDKSVINFKGPFKEKEKDIQKTNHSPSKKKITKKQSFIQKKSPQKTKGNGSNNFISNDIFDHRFDDIVIEKKEEFRVKKNLEVWDKYIFFIFYLLIISKF
jgi:hypothetical protein